jgi:hypothetical protein
LSSATTSDRSDPNGRQRRKKREVTDARLLRMTLTRSLDRGTQWHHQTLKE